MLHPRYWEVIVVCHNVNTSYCRNTFLLFSPLFFTTDTTQPEEGSVGYAHLDIAAMETAQRVGAEHIQGRQDRLTQLENRRRGPPTWLCNARLDDTSKQFSMLILSISSNKLKCSPIIVILKNTHTVLPVNRNSCKTIHSTKNKKKIGNAWEVSCVAAYGCL